MSKNNNFVLIVFLVFELLKWLNNLTVNAPTSAQFRGEKKHIWLFCLVLTWAGLFIIGLQWAGLDWIKISPRFLSSENVTLTDLSSKNQTYYFVWFCFLIGKFKIRKIKLLILETSHFSLISNKYYSLTFSRQTNSGLRIQLII